MPDSPGTVNFPSSLDTAISLIEVPQVPAQTTLVSGIDADDLSIPLTSVANFSETGVATLLDSLTEPTVLEKVVYTSISGGALIIPAGGRGKFGTTARSWSASPATYIAQFIGSEHHDTPRSAILAIEAALQSSFISVVWGSPASESGNSIEIAASCIGFAGAAFLSGLVDVRLVVSDAANDGEPSHTAVITAADTPVGTILSGSGTATVIVRTDANGNFKVKVTEPNPTSRYLWTTTGGHSRLWVRSSTGVQQLTFA